MSVAAFMLQQESWVVAAYCMVSPQSLKYLLCGPFRKSLLAWALNQTSIIITFIHRAFDESWGSKQLVDFSQIHTLGGTTWNCEFSIIFLFTKHLIYTVQSNTLEKNKIEILLWKLKS